MPSTHVWSNFESPTSPHFPNQLPPRPQQLRLPALLVPHLGHAVVAGGIVAVSTGIYTANEELFFQNTENETTLYVIMTTTDVRLLLQTRLPSSHV